MKASHVFVMALAIFAVAYAQEDEEEFDEIEVEEDIHAGSAHCVLHKEIVAENDMVVADKSFTVAYTVFNIGNAPCVDVSVRESIPNADFAIEEGSAEQFWETILPEHKESFNVTMKPTKAGVWSPARATVEYRDEGLGEDKTSLSSTLGPIQILTPVQYARDTATFELEWAVFAGMFAVAVLLPYNTYSSMSSKKKRA